MSTPKETGDVTGTIFVPEYLRPEIPNIDHLVLEDDTPVDNFFFEKLHRLLCETLYDSWPGPGDGRPFLVAANVGLYRYLRQQAVVPDVMLSLDVQLAADLMQRENRSYLVWEIGKFPEVVIEFVSDRTGGEDGVKLRDYARSGIRYYAIFDPRNLLEGGVLRTFQHEGGTYVDLPSHFFPDVGLGLTIWQGEFEGHNYNWLRWCDQSGQVIPTGSERVEAESRRAADAVLKAEQERQRADRLAARLRELGIDPDA
jgi:Putative restriction endonuclease